jgi:hypothetical protein
MGFPVESYGILQLNNRKDIAEATLSSATPITLITAASVLICPCFAIEPERPRASQAAPVANSSAKEPSADTREATPSEEARREAFARVREIYGSDLAAANTPTRKSDLAVELSRQADETTNPIDKWVLLTESLRLATDAGDAATAIPLIERIGAEYAVDRCATRLEALSRLVPKATSGQAAEVARHCLDFAWEREAASDTELAGRAVLLASAAAKKAKNSDLMAEVSRLAQKQKERQKVDKEIQPLLSKLAESPDDADLCLELGELLCFRASRWAEGLPLLQKGSDRQLAAIARLELSPPESPADHVRVGDAWWEWAESQRGATRTAAQAVAARHYSSALNQAEGLERARLEKRINAVAAISGGTGETAPLAMLPEVEVVGALNGVSKNGTFNGKAFTCGGKKFPASIFTHPSDNATAKIAFRPPAGVRRIRGHAGVFSIDGTPAGQQPGSPIVMSVVADGEVVWTSPQFTKRDQSVAFDVELRGCARLELHTTSQGSANTSWGAWLDPVLVK